MSERKSMRTLLTEVLSEGSPEFSLRADERLLVAVERHAELVERWNPVHNLTRLSGEAAARLHYADALFGCVALEGTLGSPRELLDVGSGLGLPGLVAALLWPDCRVDLLDSSRKRVSFLQRSIREMGLPNATALHGRVEDVERRWDLVISRATFPWQKLEPLTAATRDGGRVCAFVSEAPALAQWAETCAKWGGLEPQVVPYDPPGVEHRALLIARTP